MTLDTLHQKLSILAHSGMEDSHFASAGPRHRKDYVKSHLEKTERRRLKKELSVQLSLFD